jgi:hypothetical protein
MKIKTRGIYEKAEDRERGEDRERELNPGI